MAKLYVLNSYFNLSSVSAIFPAFMQSPEDQGREKIDTKITKGGSRVEKGFYVDKCDRDVFYARLAVALA